MGFKRIYAYSFVGYATSGLLDACTSYGTHLLWPFSDERVAWNIIAIVDPVFSLILMVGLLLGFRYRHATPARSVLVLATIYLMIGTWQHHRAKEVA
eukprot:UN05909